MSKKPLEIPHKMPVRKDAPYAPGSNERSKGQRLSGTRRAPQSRRPKQEAAPQKNPFAIGIRTMRFVSAVCAILLLFGLGFYSVPIVLDDTGFIEAQYTALKTDEKTGIPVPDLSRATDALFDYMRGSRDSIKVSVTRDGQVVDDLFWHDKEIVHMEEVRTLWRNLIVLATVGLLLSAALFTLIGMYGERKARLRSVGAGMLTGTALFTGVVALTVVWAISDFNSFWTVFHFLIFPSSFFTYAGGGFSVETYNALNWVFEPDFAMIRILDELFLPLVLRVGIFLGAETVAVFVAALILFRKGRRLSPPVSTLIEETVVEQEDPFEAVPDAPDLVLQHRLQNASLRQKKKLMEELRRVPGEAAASDEAPAPAIQRDPSAESEWARRPEQTDAANKAEKPKRSAKTKKPSDPPQSDKIDTAASDTDSTPDAPKSDKAYKAQVEPSPASTSESDETASKESDV